MMQPIDAITLGHLATELNDLLSGAKIQRIQQANYHELLLHVFSPNRDIAGPMKWLISIRPEHSFTCIAKTLPELTFPKLPMNLCLQLRKHLSSAKIQSVKALPTERVLWINLDNYDAIGQHRQWALVLELMGKHSNIILVDMPDNIVTACAHGVSESMSRLREIHVDVPYVPPPKNAKPSITQVSEAEFIEAVTKHASSEDPPRMLSQQFSGTSKAILQSVLENAATPAEAYQRLQRLTTYEAIRPYRSVDMTHFRLLTPAEADLDQWVRCDTVNQLVASLGVKQMDQQLLDRLKQRLHQGLKQSQKRIEGRITDLTQSIKDEDAETLKLYGDALTLAMSLPDSEAQFNAARHTEGDDDDTKPAEVSLTCMNPLDGEPLAILINPDLSLTDNAQRYYKRYKKARTRIEMAQASMQELQTQLGLCHDLTDSLTWAESLSDCRALEEDMIALGWLKSPEQLKAQTKSKKPVKAKHVAVPYTQTSDGYRVYVGRSSLQNDAIVSHLAHGNDLWLHTHNIPGAHILIKTNKQTKIPNQSLEEAAQLAVHFSQARHSANVPVIYTAARFVRKIPNSYPGHVNYTHEQSLNITPHPSVMERLTSQLSQA